eukprot:m.76888 g.76888  ORF g.76888 m.76888 type:complete len:61 (+) comp19060_c0_seq3:3915-4097(+)
MPIQPTQSESTTLHKKELTALLRSVCLVLAMVCNKEEDPMVSSTSQKIGRRVATLKFLGT